MARAHLEYDDSGSTFYYFLLSFYALVLLPLTYFLWPRRTGDGEQKGRVCQCEPCRRKRTRLEMERPKRKIKHIVSVVILVVLWGVLLVMAYKVFTMEREYTEYDPYSILELDSGASMGEIRKQYRKLSKVYHPDKEGGDQEKFMQIAKAYEALTDEESRENWEKYGNPDGPQAASFGIALPSWIVEKQNSVWVLGLYLLVFIIVLPVIVGVWWYRSIKYGHTNILLQTTQIFLYFMSKSKLLPVKRILMVLTAAFEFDPVQAKLVKGRPSDDGELNELIRSRSLPHIDIKTKERPFSCPYAAKARILVHAHLERLDLPPHTLRTDQYVILKYCPPLLSEMLNALAQVWAYGMTRRAHSRSHSDQQVPSQDTFENVMRVSQMLVQGSWNRHGPLLQLPHLLPDDLRHFRTRRRNIMTIEQFAAMKETERRLLVRRLSDEEYLDLLAVCATFPHVDVCAETQVVDDDDHHRITAGALVTVTVTLKRKGLSEYCGQSLAQLLDSAEQKETTILEDEEIHTPDEHNAGPAVENIASTDLVVKGGRGEGGEAGGRGGGVQKKAWEKQRKKKKGKQVPAKKKTIPAKKKKKMEEKEKSTEAVCEEGKEVEEMGAESEGGDESHSNNRLRKRTTTVARTRDESDEESRGSEDEDEEEWEHLQKSVPKQKNKLDLASNESHPVHAPFFPEEKQEGWWLYMAEKRSRTMVTMPQGVTTLKDECSVDLHFTAPERTGVFHYVVYLTSDSYLDLSFQKDLRLEVHEHQEVSGKAQWKELEEEEEEEEVIEESASEEEESEEDSDED